MLDTYRAIETPEGVELRLRVAGPVVRSLAWAIDLLIRGGIYIALSIVFSMFGKFGWGLLLVGLFLIEWFYPVLFEVYR
ncbi:MAG: RDD family protein, partial [Sulfuriferula sp.]